MQDDPNGGVGVCTYTQTHVRVRPLTDRDAPSSLLEEVFPGPPVLPFFSARFYTVDLVTSRDFIYNLYNLLFIKAGLLHWLKGITHT